MKIAVKESLMATVILSMVLSPAVNATNGYFAYGHSTAEKGLAGAGAAYSHDALASATNPAGMAFVGERIDFGAALFSPAPRGFSSTGASNTNYNSLFTGPHSMESCNYVVTVNGEDLCRAPLSINEGEYKSANELFLLPSLGFNWQMNSDTTLGFSIYRNGQMNTEYTNTTATGIVADDLLLNENLDGVFGSGNTGMNHEQVFLNFSVATKTNENQAFGVSLIAAAQRFSVKGLGGFEISSLDPEKLSNNQSSKSLGAGIKLGYQGEIADGLRLGASYQSKIHMSKSDEYAGLLAGGGELDIPSTYSVGVAFEGNDNVFVIDVQRINYSEVAALSNPMSNLDSCTDSLNATLVAESETVLPASGNGCFGGSDGPGFGWQDITILKLGYQVDVDNMTYRFGYSRTSELFSDSEVLLNILTQATTPKHRFTSGLTARIGKDQEFSLSGMVAPKTSQTGDNLLDGPGDTKIEIEALQWEIQAGWAWRY